MSKKKKESPFMESLQKSFEKKREASLPEEERKAIRYAKIESIFGLISDKKNKYIFYCPDIPFGTSLVSTIYEHAYLLKTLGFNTVVLHEVKGYKPTWLGKDWVKDVKVEYLQEKRKDGSFTTPSYNFMPTDTIVVPETYWSVMQNFAQDKILTKVVLAFGYGGLSNDEIGADWSMLGFTNVICLSEQIKEDYKKIFPHLTYHVINYVIDTNEFKPIEVENRKPVIGLSVKSRADAAAVINIFHHKYPYLGMFEFRILKKLSSTAYRNSLQECALLLNIDEKAGHSAPPLEALACDVPTLTPYSRGLSHLTNNAAVMFINTTDWFIVAESIANFCIEWLETPTAKDFDKTILNNYSVDSVKKQLVATYDNFQIEKSKVFSAVKAAIDEGKLDGAIFDDLNIEDLQEIGETTDVESVLKLVK